MVSQGWTPVHLAQILHRWRRLERLGVEGGIRPALRTDRERESHEGLSRPLRIVDTYLPLRLWNSNLSDRQEDTTFTASSPMPAPLRAVKFCDAPCYQAAIVCAMTFRVFYLRAHRPRSALQGRLAPT
jgi:hypothetical protein